MGKLLAIDGMNIVRRVYEANDETEPAAKAELALRHALSSFRKLLATHAPTHVLPVFDAGGRTWRHDVYAGYREHREAVPADLQAGMAGFCAQLGEWGLTPVSVHGVEADDVIATAVLRWLQEARGEAIIASTDKDLHGLIADGALLWDHFRGEWHDAEWVETKFGVSPALLPDLLALTGDAADGIPGVQKVGVKTAAKLLQNYGDIDRIMSGAGILKDALGERLRQDSENLAISRRLVALKTDVRIGVSWNMLAFDIDNLR